MTRETGATVPGTLAAATHVFPQHLDKQLNERLPVSKLWERGDMQATGPASGQSRRGQPGTQRLSNHQDAASHTPLRPWANIVIRGAEHGLAVLLQNVVGADCNGRRVGAVHAFQPTCVRGQQQLRRSQHVRLVERGSEQPLDEVGCAHLTCGRKPITCVSKTRVTQTHGRVQ